MLIGSFYRIFTSAHCIDNPNVEIGRFNLHFGLFEYYLLPIEFGQLIRIHLVLLHRQSGSSNVASLLLGDRSLLQIVRLSLEDLDAFIDHVTLFVQCGDRLLRIDLWSSLWNWL